MNIKFGLQNKRNLMMGGISIIILVILFQFVYFSKSREVKILDSEYKKIKSDIDELYNFIGGRENLKDNIIKMRNELGLLERAFPSEKEVSNIINELNKKAKHFNVSVVSLKPRNLEIFKGHEGKELKISDCFCKCMPLTLKVESRYRSLGEFLISIETNKMPMVSIEKVDMGKDKNISPSIKADIELTAYILGK